MSPHRPDDKGAGKSWPLAFRSCVDAICKPCGARAPTPEFPAPRVHTPYTRTRGPAWRHKVANTAGTVTCAVTGEKPIRK